MRAWLFLVVAAYSMGCGGKVSPPANSSQHELDQRHCTANADCASGFCNDGRCG